MLSTAIDILFSCPDAEVVVGGGNILKKGFPCLSV